MKSRRRARSAALKVLYELDTTTHLPGIVLTTRLAEETLSPESEVFARQLVTGVLEHRQQLDQLIQHYAPEWPIEQMAVIDRNLLRIAIYEFDVAGLTPLKVAINEAIEIAKIYGAESTPRFINGVLGSLVAPVEAARRIDMEVFGVGPFELLLVAIIGFLVLGPERIPGVLRTLGATIRKVQQATQKMMVTQSGEKINIPHEVAALQRELLDLRKDFNQITQQFLAAPEELLAPPKSSLPPQLSQRVDNTSTDQIDMTDRGTPPQT